MVGKQKQNLREELFELAPQAMVLLNSAGQIIQFNQRFSALFGYEPVELEAQALARVLPTYQPRQPTHAGQASSLFVLDLDGKHKDNRRIPLKVTGRLLATGEDARLLLSLCEIGEYRQAEIAPNPLHYAVVEWWMNERRRLAQQLHKGALQEIQGINFSLAALAGAPDLNAEITHELVLARDSVQRLAQEVRSLQQELFPPTLADFGVAAAIRSYTKQLQTLYPTLKIQLKLDEGGAQLPLVSAATLFSIYKQALLQLGEPSDGYEADGHEVTIKLQIDAETVVLEISVDDRLDVLEQWITITHKEHLGLMSAIKCAEALGGQCETRSAPPKGSMLCITLPIAFQP